MGSYNGKLLRLKMNPPTLTNLCATLPFHLCGPAPAVWRASPDSLSTPSSEKA